MPRTASEIDPQAAADCLAWLAVAAPRTIYRGVFGLQPGECARWQAGQLELRTAWNFRDIPVEKPCANRLDFQCELRRRLDDTIRAHAGSHVALADEYAVVDRLGLHESARLLAQRLARFSQAIVQIGSRSALGNLQIGGCPATSNQ